MLIILCFFFLMNFGTLLVAFNTEDFCQMWYFSGVISTIPLPFKLVMYFKQEQF
uniref:G-protein coupled receptors family 1 profile domain-containing protein n=1 Tax=Anguilla anguilla TaxID=7936 RepID=A0A0E9RAK3_ANGAN